MSQTHIDRTTITDGNRRASSVKLRGEDQYFSTRDEQMPFLS